MSEEQKDQGQEDREPEAAGERSTRQKVEDGLRSGLGVLSAFKDALEETIQEARERGDLSADRAREIVKDAVHKAQDAASGARERLDFVTQSELETVERAVEALAERVQALEDTLSGSGNEGTEGEEEPAAQ